MSARASVALLPLLLLTGALGCQTTHGSDDGGEPSPLCGPPTWEDWDRLEGSSDLPSIQRGGGGGHTCQQPTSDLSRIKFEASLPEGGTLSNDGAVQVLIFEYDPDVADGGPLCVNLACESTDGSDLSWRLDVPVDRSDLGYYVRITVDDGDGNSFEGCDFFASEFFETSDNVVNVPLDFSNGAC